jgi:hypothetical protein
MVRRFLNRHGRHVLWLALTAWQRLFEERQSFLADLCSLVAFHSCPSPWANSARNADLG